MNFLPSDFYARDTGLVAKELLGKTLVRQLDGQLILCRIVETEAYYGRNDPASHAARGQTARNKVMFGSPGRAYVYFNYGMHYLFNVVTEPEGTAGAVLIRALEPVSGADAMLVNRPVVKLANLTNGPAKLTQALRISRCHNGLTLVSAELGIIDDKQNGFRVVSARRIGISAGQELEYRFYLAGNEFVSRT